MSDRPVALVTGAARGIGLAIASRLAEDGFDLFVADLGPGLDEAADRLRRHDTTVEGLTGDISEIAVHELWMRRIEERAGRLDCLVNNAGMGAVIRGDVLDLRPEHFDRVMAVNLRGTAFLTLAALKTMVKQAPGPVPRSIVNISSVSATRVSPDRLDYCVSKAALSMWSKGLAVRFAPEGIGVFDVRPGIIRTEMTTSVSEKYDRWMAEGVVPAARWGEGEDVAKVVSTLASGVFSFATGSVIDIGGGLSIGRL